MIILEGPDGSGKTTVSDLIIKHWHGVPPNNYDCKVVHSPGPLPEHLFDWAMNTLKEAKPVQVLDRFPYFSESVYGPALRATPLMAVREFIVLRERLMRIRPLVIYCRPPKAMLAESQFARQQMEGVHENYDRLVDGYDLNYAHWIRDFRAFSYDFTQGMDSMKRLLYAVKEYISEEKRGEWI